MAEFIGGIVIALFIGAIIGWIAAKIMKADLSLPMTIAAGVVGSFVGSFLLWALGLEPRNGFWNLVWGWGAGILGAVVLIAIFGASKRSVS